MRLRLPHTSLLLAAFLAVGMLAGPARADEAPVEVASPVVFTAPAGRILPSGVIFPRASFDTSKSFLGEVRFGLAGLVEVGFVSTPYVRFERPLRDRAEFFDGYPMLLGRLGLDQGRLWDWQPGITLGYRKSFIVTQFERQTQLSEITLAVTADLGAHVVLTAGLAKWDGEIAFDERGEKLTWALDEQKSYTERIRPFVGLEVHITPGLSLLGEYYFMPEFEYAVAAREPEIELDAAASFGMRATLRPWLIIDFGARAPDFTNMHQIDAEIFGQLSVPLRFLRAIL